MAGVAFDTLKLARRLEAAGLPAGQAEEMAIALSDTIGEEVVTREYLDLRLAELKAELLNEIVSGKADTMKWMFGTAGLQVLAILGGMATLLRMLH